MRRKPESVREEDRRFFNLPHLDAMYSVAFEGAEVDRIGAVRGDASNCVFNHCLRRGDLHPNRVFGTKTWAIIRATQALIEFNKSRGVRAADAVSPGDEVVVVYANDTALRVQIRLWDHDGREFTVGTFTLRVPNRSTTLSRARNKGGDRRGRADARAEGRVPQKRTVAQITRIATIRESLTREVADPS